MTEDFELIGLMCSRLCHDLVGPIGAIVNGIELIEDSADDVNLRDQSLCLIGESAHELAARLKFFRVAFGSGGGRIPFSAGEFCEVASSFLGGRRISFTYTSSEEQIERSVGRLLLGLCLLGTDSLPQGGGVTLTYVPGEQVFATLLATGRRARPSPDLAALLADGGPPEALEARAAGTIFVWRLAAKVGAAISFEQEDGAVVICLTRT